MHKFRVLAGVAIDTGQELTGAALQRRRLALLAAVAATGSRGVSRDKLLGLFWPERTEERGRHALAQSLHALRRSLRSDELFEGTDTIRLNPRVIDVDLWRFEQAVAEGAFSEAVAIYSGPFLDGVYLNDAPEFEHWVEAERQRLQRLCYEVLEKLAMGAESRGDPRAAAAWWRRLAAMDPLAAEPALGLMRTLAAAGDTPAALRHAQTYSALLHTEHGINPPAHFVAFVRRLHDEEVQGLLVRQADPPQAAMAHDPVEAEERPPNERDRRGVIAVAAATPETSSRLGQRRGRQMVAAAGSVLGLLALLAYAGRRNDLVSEKSDWHHIAVVPFSVEAADTSLTRLARDLAVTLSANLDGVDEIRTVDPAALAGHASAAPGAISLRDAAARAHQLGASSIIYGSLVRVGSMVRLDFRLLNTDAVTSLARVTVVAPVDSLEALTDSATWALLRQTWRRGTTPTPTIEGLTTHSLEALRAFLQGERLRAEGQHALAAKSYYAAMESDSTFWLAYVRYAAAKRWIEEFVDPAVTRAYETHADLLPRRERLLVQARMAQSLTTRLGLMRKATAEYPDNWLAWMTYADALIHGMALLGHDVSEARAPLEHVVELNPAWAEGWEHLLWVTPDSDATASDSILVRLARLGWDTASTAEFGYDELLLQRVKRRLRRDPDALVRPAGDSLVRAFAIARIRPSVIDQAIQGLLQMDDDARGQLELSRRVLRHGTNDENRVWHLQAIALAWAGRGEWDSAQVAIDKYQQTVNSPASLRDAYRVAAVGAYFDALDDRIAEQRRASLQRAWMGLNSVDRAEALFLDGILATHRNDRMSLRDAMARLRTLAWQARRSPPDTSTAIASFTRSLAAFDLYLAGKHAEALDSLASAEWQRSDYPLAPLDGFRLAITRLTLARWYLAGGQPEQAIPLLTWQQTIYAPRPWFFAACLVRGLTDLERARAEDRRGRRQEAVNQYRQFLRRYEYPVARHYPLVIEAQRALARLGGERARDATRRPSPSL